DEILAEIRGLYREYTDPRGGEKVNLQGIVFETNEGGRLPLASYLVATLSEREALASGQRTVESVAREHGLNAPYLGTLWRSLTGSEPSLLLDVVRARWRTAGAADAAGLVAEIAGWQKALWKFGTVGHIGKVGGPKRWLEPVIPLAAKLDFRLKIPATPAGDEVKILLIAGDAGDGHGQDRVVWERPRLVAPGRPDLPLREVRGLTRDLAARR